MKGEETLYCYHADCRCPNDGDWVEAVGLITKGLKGKPVCEDHMMLALVAGLEPKLLKERKQDAQHTDR